MTKKFIKEYAIITFGAALAAAAIYFFMLPSQVVVGSGAALAMVLHEFFPACPVSVFSFSLNMFFLLLGFLLVGREFGAKTVYTCIVIPAVIGIFEQVFADFTSLTNDPFLDILCYILVVGLAMAILFSHNASSGGLDIVAKIFHKYFKMGLGAAVSVSGMMVALLSVFCYPEDTKLVVLSLLSTYFGGMILDRFIFGINIKRRVCIISPKLDEILDFILYELHSGATLYDGIGGFDGTIHKEINAIVDKHEYLKLMDFIRETDPSAFVTVYAVSEMRYTPKRHIQKENKDNKEEIAEKENTLANTK